MPQMPLTSSSTPRLADAVSAREFYAPGFDGPGRPCDVPAELRRSARLEEWLNDLDRASVVSARIPRVDQPLISVIVPMFNASKWIDTTLKSLLLQQENIEIFCVDDASTDDTYDRVTSRFGEDGRVCAVRLDRNVGPYQIRNWVARHLARGQWLAFQDADDFSHPNRLAVQKDRLQRQRVIACGCCIHQVFPEDIIPKRGDTEPWPHRGLFHSLVFYSDVPRALGAEPAWQLLVERVPSIYFRNGKNVRHVPVSDSPALYPALMIKRDVFLSLGGFEGRTMVAADRTFAMRLLRFYPLANSPAVLYTRHIHRQSLTQRPDTGYSSSLRVEHIRAGDEIERRVCGAVSENDWAKAAALCTSDLYCADIAVADWHAHFRVPWIST